MRKEVCCLCIAAVLFLLLGSLFPLIVRDQALTPFGGTAAVEEDRQLLGEITAGTVVEQPLPPGELHDIRLVFGTYGDRVTSHLLVEVVAEGETLYRTSLDGSSLRDNAGKSIVLPEALQLPPGACLRITSDDAVPGNALTLWTVPLSVLGAVGEEMALHVDGKAQGRVLCASWNTLPAHSTRLCAWEWGIAAVGGLLLAALLVFCAKASSFLVRAGAVGAAVLCYLLIVSPLLFVPDSVAHFLRSYVFIRTGGVAYLYPAGMEHIMPAVGAVLADALSPLQTVAAAQTFGTMLRAPVPLPLYSTLIPYLPQAFGMLLPYLFDAPVFFYDIGARLLNAFCYALCCALACRVAPRSLRVLFAGVSLLPILLYFAASVSGDTLLNGAAILYTALLFKEEQTASVRRRYGLSLMAVGILIMSAKATYAPLVLLHWLVGRRTGLSRAAWLAYDAALLLGAKLWNGYIIGRNIAEFGALLPGRETVVPALQQAYVLHHPLHFLALAGETFVRESGSYLHHLASLGNLNVLMDVAFYLLVPYLLLLALGREQEQPAFALPRRTLAWGALACLASVLLIYLGLYMTWTPVGAPAISGVQGRYFLPLLPLLLILVRGALPHLQCRLPRLELLVLLLAADIYVYDNNSTDHTDEIARAAGAIVRYERRQGKGNVIRTMFREIDADCYLMIDGDDTYPAESARDLVDGVLTGGADMVIGDRLSSTYFEENKRPFHNFGNVLVRRFINMFWGRGHAPIVDVMTGMRAFSPLFVKSFPVLSRGFEIETEMTIHALDKNLLVTSLPIAYRDRPAGSESKLSTYSDGARVLLTIFRLYRCYQPLRFFGGAALVLLILSLAFFLPVLADYFATGSVPRFPTLIVSSITMLAAALSFVCGLILDTHAVNARKTLEIQMNILELLRRR